MATRIGAAPGERGGHVVAVALDARLFGRIRLLTLDAAIDVAPRSGDREPRRLPSGAGRAEAEVLLSDARKALAEARVDECEVRSG